MTDLSLTETIKTNGKRAKGRSELLKYLDGERLTYKLAVNAKCYECMGYCIDGLIDCTLTDCPLYPFMPYNPNRIKRNRKNRVEQKL
jgi:hypothetical protein